MSLKKLDLLRIITSSNYLYNFSSSYSNKALTASYAMNGGGGGGGTSGTSGASGTSGSSGSSGESGTSGSSGTSATAGSSGTSGVGSPGTSGSSGESGTSGSSGTSATAGSSGTSGVGSPGTSGSSGNSGTSGSSGESGTSGSSGSGGSSGTSATAGSSGTSGVGSPGTSGSSGNSGTSGSSGQSGTSGSSGSGGSSGTSGVGSPGSSGTSGTSSTPALSLGQTYIGDGTSTVYALSQSLANKDQILVNVDGVLQGRNGNYYTVSGTTLTLSSPPQNGSIIDIRYINGGGGIVTSGSIANQTLWTNVTSGSTNTITGLNLSSNKWNVNVIEEWDATVLDQYYNSCSLLCHFDTINSAGRFIDNSRNNLAITSSGNVSVNTYLYKFGGGSAYFDGTGDLLFIPTSNNFGFGTGDFTIEFWVYLNSTATQTLVSCLTTGTSIAPHLYILSGGSIRYYTNSADRIVGSNLVVSTWYFVTIARSGTSTKMFIDGVQVGSTYTDNNNYGTSNPFIIADYGSPTTGTNQLNGYIDELRITKGVARYTANFTPPNAPFPNSRAQILTKYVGLVGGVDDKYVDYGVQKLSDSSIKLTRLTYPNQPVVGSGSLSGSVSRVYVNVLDYTKVLTTSSYATRTLTASYSLKSGNALRTGSLYPITASRAVSSSYLLGGSQILTANKTVAFSSSFTTTQIQALIDVQPKNLGGKILTFQFADGNYNLSTGLTFFNFSNGTLLIYGNSSNNTVAAAKNVTLSGSLPIYIANNSTYTEVNYLRLSVNTSTYQSALIIENGNANIYYCSFTNHPRSVTVGSGNGVMTQAGGTAWVRYSYFSSMDRYIVSLFNGIITADTNSQGTNSNIAYLAYGGIIQVQNTGLTAITTYSTAVGGLIVRPSGTTIGT